MLHRIKTTGPIAIVLVALGAAQAAEVKIGMLYPITGGGALYGSPAVEGHRMAVDELNSHGGILGMQVVTVERDTKLNPATAAAAVPAPAPLPLLPPLPLLCPALPPYTSINALFSQHLKHYWVFLF